MKENIKVILVAVLTLAVIIGSIVYAWTEKENLGRLILDWACVGILIETGKVIWFILSEAWKKARRERNEE
jgi:hypothetical protein